MLKQLLNHLNPFVNLGKKDYKIFFPLLFMVAYTVILETYAYGIAKNPQIVGLPAIILNLVFIVYFSLRNGLKSGFIATGITILYYVYIVYTRHYQGQRLTSSINTIVALGFVYLIISTVIGWLKQRIDSLISKEMEARIHAEESRARLESIIDQLPVGVIITDREGRLDIANKHADLITGMKVPGFTLGKPETYSLRNDNTNIATEHGKPIKDGDWPLVQAFSTGKPVEKYISLKRKDGRKFYLQLTASIIRSKNKEFIAAAEIINDVTQQKEIEDRKDDFINMASHELKTPLTSAKIFLGSLKLHLKNQGDEKGQQFLEKTDKQITKLTNLVKELLDVTSINQGRLKLNQESFSIGEIVKEIVEDLQPTTPQKLQIKSSTDQKVTGDKEKIMQVLANFITNAIKYSPPEKNIILNTKKEGTNVVVSVQDFGIGISKQQQEKVFGRFYQAHQTEESTYPGIGLGLFIAAEIIRLHKGKIWVKSTEGKGSTFFFSLPIES